MNKKLQQTIEVLKTQLDKEKEKNKALTKERGKSSTQSLNTYFNLKLRNEKVFTKSKHKKVNKSTEILKKANIFINREKNDNKNINEKEINNNINQNNINVKTNINIIIKNKEEKKEENKNISSLETKEKNPNENN